MTQPQPNRTERGLTVFPENVCPDPSQLPAEFLEFLKPLHDTFTPWQERCAILRRAQLLRSPATPIDHVRNHRIHLDKSWSCNVPEWAQDQRNQMTGPADDGDLVVKMLNSGAPGVMIDLEDSMCNRWEHTVAGIDNAVAALHGTLTYTDKKGNVVGIKPSQTVTFTRVRGLHMQQRGVLPEAMSASLFDAAYLIWRLDPSKLKHPICIYIPKSETAEEAFWWDELFTQLERAKGLPENHIRCMALVESHPLAYRMEEFLYYLKDRILGLNFGRWDYIASTLQYNAHDPDWMICDRNAIPHDAPFLQNVRSLMVKVCHSRGALAIGGMTAFYPSRADAAVNAESMVILKKDKDNEARCGMDGAWTGHPDQNDIAVGAFPIPNQLHVVPDVDRYIDLRPSPKGLAQTTVDGTKSSARTAVLYRAAVLAGKGAVLINHRMEDLATDRICRDEIIGRIRHGFHTHEEVEGIFADVLMELLDDPKHNPQPGGESAKRLGEAMVITLWMIKNNICDPT